MASVELAVAVVSEIGGGELSAGTMTVRVEVAVLPAWSVASEMLAWKIQNPIGPVLDHNDEYGNIGAGAAEIFRAAGRAAPDAGHIP